MTVPGGARTQESRLHSQSEPLAVQPPRGSKLSSDRLRGYGGALRWSTAAALGQWGERVLEPGETEAGGARREASRERGAGRNAIRAFASRGGKTEPELQDRAPGTGGTGRG